MRWDTCEALRKNLIDFKGLQDGWRGIFLSFFHAWYIMMCDLALLCNQSLKARNSRVSLDP